VFILYFGEAGTKSQDSIVKFDVKFKEALLPIFTKSPVPSNAKALFTSKVTVFELPEQLPEVTCALIKVVEVIAPI
jgi:hypothetical protein